MKGYYKVPAREVYCGSLRGWVASVFHCHVWLRIFPPNLPVITDASAHLIAAAPAMLEALIDAVEHCYGCAGTAKRSARSAGYTSEWECGFCDKQRAAIKLAKGAA